MFSLFQMFRNTSLVINSIGKSCAQYLLICFHKPLIMSSSGSQLVLLYGLDFTCGHKVVTQYGKKLLIIQKWSNMYWKSDIATKKLYTVFYYAHLAFFCIMFFPQSGLFFRPQLTNIENHWYRVFKNIEYLFSIVSILLKASTVMSVMSARTK